LVLKTEAETPEMGMFFWLSGIPDREFVGWAMNLAADAVRLSPNQQVLAH